MKDVILIGDCLNVLKTIDNDCIDMGVTSPPYNKCMKSKSKNQIFGPIEYKDFDDNLPENIYQQQQINVLNELHRIIKPGGSFFYNHKVRHIKGEIIHPMEWLRKTNWTIRQEIIWNRKACTEVGGYRFYQVDERIYWMYKPIKSVIGSKMLGKHAKMTSVWEFPPDRKNPHPAPFPIVLPLRCILSFMDEEPGIVIDPYSGSGSTLIASKLLNKNYIGIDLTEEYKQMSLERLQNINRYNDILERELSLHVVKTTYEERKKKLKDKI